MAVTIEQVRDALSPDRPDYRRLANELGAAALPSLESIVGASDRSLAAKAAYLVGLIGGPGAAAALETAARSNLPTVRIAAAAAAAHLPVEQRDSLLLRLVDDEDSGVRKVALRSAKASEALRARVLDLTKRLKKPNRGPQ